MSIGIYASYSSEIKMKEHKHPSMSLILTSSGPTGRWRWPTPAPPPPPPPSSSSTPAPFSPYPPVMFWSEKKKDPSHIPMSFFHLHCQGGPRPVKLECPGDEGWWFIVQPAFKRGWWSWWWSSWWCWSWWCWSWQWWSWWCWSSKWWTKWRGWAVHSSPAVPPSLYYPRDDGRDGGDDHGGDDHGGGDERRCVNAFLSSPPSLYYSQVSLYLSFSLSEHSYHHHQQLYQTFKSLKNEVLEGENDMGRPFAREGMISAVSSEPFRVGATFTLFFHWNTWWQWWYFFLILFNTDIFWVPLCESPPQLCTGYTWPPPTAKSSFQ